MELLDGNTNTYTANIAKSNINLKKEIGRYLKKWPWFLGSMLVFFIAAKIYLRYTQPEYLTKIDLKLNQSKNKNTTLSDMKSLGMGISDDEELEGETTVVISKPILKAVVQNLNLNVSFYSLGKIKEVELYKDSPLTGGVIKVTDPNFSSVSYILETFGKNYFRLKWESGQLVGTYPYNVFVKMPFGIAEIDQINHRVPPSPIRVTFRSVDASATMLAGSINVTIPENKGRLMELSVIGPVPQKSQDILNEIAKQYNLDGIKDKNQEAENTQDFINDRLNIISEDLSGIENQKEKFKQQNQITDLESQANLAMGQMNENTKTIFNLGVQLDMANSMAAAANSSSDQLLPTNMGLPTSLDADISKYNDLILIRNRVLKQATNVNPSIIQMNREISTIKNTIRKEISEVSSNLQRQLAHSRGLLSDAKTEINEYPTQEKEFRSIERQQNLKEQLYLYLLQKREENAITLAANADKAKIVAPAFTVGKIKPNDKQIMTGALAVGFLLPLLFFLGKNLVDTRVHNKQHIISHISNASVIAEIPVIEEKNALVHPNDFSVYAESFRILASNLKFLLKTKNENADPKGVILVTSSIKGEGKTTIAMNLALTLAGKSKVFLLGADIRNPQLQRFIDGQNIGLTDYLVSNEQSPEKFIKNSKISKNLDVMFSGEIAPNPNDLLDMEKFDHMISRLRENYEYIVMDSAPVMLVSDTMHLIEISDCILYVIKSDYTEKEMLSFVEEFKKNNSIKNLSFILNAVRPENTKYGTKYGYGYYNYGKKSRKS